MDVVTVVTNGVVGVTTGLFSVRGGFVVLRSDAALLPDMVDDVVMTCESGEFPLQPDKNTIATSRAKQRNSALFLMIKTNTF